MKKFLRLLTSLFLIGTASGILVSICIFNYYNAKLPSIEQLKNYNPILTSRLYTNNGRLLKEYAKEKRLFVPIDNIPKLVKDAFIVAEDADFYYHFGISIKSIISAAIDNARSNFDSRKIRGGSTITQQVAKNFLLTNDKTLERKIKEAILSLKITRAIPKNKVLELYLNQIFLGARAYGVAAGALNYFNKSLDDLEIEEVALLAALPKAPGHLNPKVNYSGALKRRNWVIGRLYEKGLITKDQMDKAIKTEIHVSEKESSEYFIAGSFTEDARKKIIELTDENTLLTGGLVITTTLDPDIQEAMREALKNGIEAYERRYGYRGSLGNIYDDTDFENTWPEKLATFHTNSYIRNGWLKAVILDINNKDNRAKIGLLDTKTQHLYDITVNINGKNYITSYLDFKSNNWAISREDKAQKKVATKIQDLNIRLGDVILVKASQNSGYLLRQVPVTNGGAVMLDPHTGRILGMVGGYIDSETNFNRVTQATRQIGSTIKPFVYLSAFENGYSPASIVVDEEITLDQGYGLPPYTPHNYYADMYYGPITLRTALKKSHNVATVRLADQLGLNKVTEMIRRLNINKQPQALYSMVLGSLETKLIDLTRAYAILVNGGKEIDLNLIEKIQDQYGKIIYRMDNRECPFCIVTEENIDKVLIPELKDKRKSIIDPANAYQIIYILEDAVKNGTGWRAKAIGKTIGGKTGTSNNYKDTWFIGFSPDFVMGVYVGYDNSISLGDEETGSRTALPIFVSAMKNILKDKADIPFRVPENIEFIKIDNKTGQKPNLSSDKNDIIFEAFKINSDKTIDNLYHDKESIINATEEVEIDDETSLDEMLLKSIKDVE